MNENILNEIKIKSREKQLPYFDDSEIEFWYNDRNENINDTVYKLLILKSQDTTLSISGLSTNDTSNYFKRLASKYRRFNTGILKGDV